MAHVPTVDWDPRSAEVLADQIAAYDEMRSRCPVAHSPSGDWAAMPRGRVIDVMKAFPEPFSNQVQCAFMGWPARLHEPLRAWVRKNQEATRALDREALAAVATEFDSYIREQLEERRAAGVDGSADTTSSLLRETIDGRPLADEEIVSIVRNGTVGELGTITASLGILIHHLAVRPETAEQLRAGEVDLARASDETSGSTRP